ncbi:hypothetical protein FKM82_022953 [Ascaphus truei]
MADLNSSAWFFLVSNPQTDFSGGDGFCLNNLWNTREQIWTGSSISTWDTSRVCLVWNCHHHDHTTRGLPTSAMATPQEAYRPLP